MSESAENTSNQGGNTPSENTPGAGDEFEPITSQDDLNRVIADRIRREREKFADYKDLKSKAAKLDELETANQSEAEKVAGERDAAIKERDAAQAELLRLQVSIEKGLTPSQAKRLIGGTREELESDADELLRDLEAAGKPRRPKPDPNQGRESNGTATTADQFAAAIGGQFTT